MNNNKTNRRNFLKTSAVLGASIFLPKSIAMATDGSSDDQRIIIIGAGLAGLLKNLVIMFYYWRLGHDPAAGLEPIGTHLQMDYMLKWAQNMLIPVMSMSENMPKNLLSPFYLRNSMMGFMCGVSILPWQI